jgi:hypothetical protein
MSVVVEAVNLVVPRSALELRYPGGVEGFFAELARPSSEHRDVCADEHLVSVSFYAIDAADRAAAALVLAGMRDIEDNQFQDFAIVDQNYGPTVECPWLAWEHNESGFTCAWLANTERGDLAVPLDWSISQSLRLTRFDARTPPNERLKLAEEENGVETWLDMMTGRIRKRLRRGINRERRLTND